MLIDASTRYCAVLGSPIKHSASPAMHNAALSALGLNWRYLAFPVEPRVLAEALTGAKAMHFIGLNLTVPHKILALDLVDELDHSAKSWGAVNTIRFEAQAPNGEWLPLSECSGQPSLKLRSKGFNTDADALARALREDLKVKLAGAHVLQVGAGGAGRMAGLKLAAEGIASISIVNRTPGKAELLAQEIQKKYPLVKAAVGYPAGQVDLLLNATSLGLNPDDPLPLPIGKFPLARAKCVYDMIYQPPETTLLRRAREAGCRAANGLGMLLYQGAAALELWCQKPPPIEIMRAALQEHIYGPSRL